MDKIDAKILRTLAHDAGTTATEIGERVIIQRPNRPDYRDQIGMVNTKTVYAKADEKNDFKMTADVIKSLIADKTKLIIINFPPICSVLDWKICWRLPSRSYCSVQICGNGD